MIPDVFEFNDVSIALVTLSLLRFYVEQQHSSV